MTPTEALATALNAVFDAIDFKNPHKSLSAIAAILAALDGYERVARLAAPAGGLDVERLIEAELRVHSWPRDVARSEAIAIAREYAALEANHE